MKYERFEDVPVWQDGIELTIQVFTLTGDPSFRSMGDIANQIQRAALSVPNNIAEGFERGTTQELIAFLYYAKGSAGEVRSICHVIMRLPHFAHLRPEIAKFLTLAESVSRQLSAWARSLQDSDIEGPRRLSTAKKAAYEQNKRAESFMQRLRQEHRQRIEESVRKRENQEDGK